MSEYSRTLAELTKLTEETATSRVVARALVKKTTLDLVAHQALLHATAPNGVVPSYTENARADDGEPPGTPQNVEVVPVTHGLAVSWDMPPESDRVKLAKVRVTPYLGLPTIYDSVTLINLPVLNLQPAVSHTVEVSFVDAFSAQSGWCAPITATPNRAIAEEIDLEELSILGRIQGLLPNESLATLEDVALFGEGVVTAQAMAVQDAVALNLWVQNAAIQSAKIAEISADKLTTGTLVASTISLSSNGVIQAGDHTTLNAGGITLGLHESFDTSVAASSFKISGEGGIGAMMFYSENTETNAEYDTRGIILRADGSSTDLPGGIILAATPNGDINEARVGYISVLAGLPGQTGAVYTRGLLLPLDGIDLRRSVTGIIGQGSVSSAKIASGAPSYAVPHTFGVSPGSVFVQVSPDGENWYPVSSSTTWPIAVTPDTVFVTNNSGGPHYIRVKIVG